eukprot:scaffold100706_cov31-Tisochrysis_lutea.AAC.2
MYRELAERLLLYLGKRAAWEPAQQLLNTSIPPRRSRCPSPDKRGGWRGSPGAYLAVRHKRGRLPCEH